MVCGGDGANGGVAAHRRLLPEGFPPLRKRREYGHPNPGQHLLRLGLAHMPNAMPPAVANALRTEVEGFFNKATKVSCAVT